MINEQLLKLDLSEKEIAVYLALLQRGKATAAQLSRVTGINRTTVYSVAKELAEKDLIVEDLGATPSMLVALPPQHLKDVITKDEQKIQEKKNLVDKLIPQLFALAQDTQYSPPRIKFTAEEDLDQYLYQQSKLWTESLMKYDQTWWGLQDVTFAEHYADYIDWHWSWAPKNMLLKMVADESKAEQALARKGYARRHIKYWKGAENFTAGMWICGDYVIMAVTSQRPHYLVEIYDTVLAHNMRELFKRIWEELD
jgi:hypothetical protein